MASAVRRSYDFAYADERAAGNGSSDVRIPDGRTVGSKLISRHGPSRSAWTCCAMSVPTSIDRRLAGQASVGSAKVLGVESTCQRLGIKAVPAEVRAPNDLDAAFQALANDHVQAVIVLVDGMLFSERTRIAALAAASRLPAIYGFRDHVDAGGLASYGVNLSENFNRAATYVSKILKGAKPGDLPVEFPTKLELVVNNKAAKALGLNIPPSVLVRADDVIE